MRTLALSSILLLAACTDRCKQATVFLSYSLIGGAERADTIDVTLTIGGGTPQTKSASRKNGDSAIEIDFQAYPKGQSLTFTVTARMGNTVLASSSVTTTAGSDCTAIKLTLDGALLDLSALSDAGPSIEMASRDLAGLADLVGRDLICPQTQEDCFNGVDDNCDNLVDCADPQCNGIGECVPDPGGAVAGTLSASACPTPFPSAAPIYSGLTAGSCGAGSCACFNGFAGTPACSATLYSHGTDNTCPVVGQTIVFGNSSAAGCFAIAPTSSTTYYNVVPSPFNGTCNNPTAGMSTQIAPSWSTTYAFCGGNRVGAGCGSSQVCVPVAANHCVLEMGSQSACNVAGYSVQNPTGFYTGFDDSTRACSCVCNASGTCSSSLGLGPGGCAATQPIASCTLGPSNFDHALIFAPTGKACNPGGAESGATSTAGFERTLCCLH